MEFTSGNYKLMEDLDCRSENEIWEYLKEKEEIEKIEKEVEKKRKMWYI
jgi:hypothetical protein